MMANAYVKFLAKSVKNEQPKLVYLKKDRLYPH